MSAVKCLEDSESDYQDYEESRRSSKPNHSIPDPLGNASAGRNIKISSGNVDDWDFQLCAENRVRNPSIAVALSIWQQ